MKTFKLKKTDQKMLKWYGKINVSVSCCNNPFCDGKKHKLLDNRTLCEYERDVKKVFNNYKDPRDESNKKRN